MQKLVAVADIFLSPLISPARGLVQAVLPGEQQQRVLPAAGEGGGRHHLRARHLQHLRERRVPRGGLRLRPQLHHQRRSENFFFMFLLKLFFEGLYF